MKNIFFTLFLFFCVASCNKNNKKTIILSKASDNYINWIESRDIIIIDAYNISNIDSILNLADGIILTGGEDIYPLMYNDTNNIKLCGVFDFRRDTLEKKLFDYAFNNKLPLIGVCRGMQMMNVASGGTLFGDLPTEIGDSIKHRNNGEVMHNIMVTNNNIDNISMIFPVNGKVLPKKQFFKVNSWHHQGLKEIAENIIVIAVSYDGLPEAVVINKKVHPFMIGVQFHPERLGKYNPIHVNMKDKFFQQIFK
ncbi:MAG: gamma-glutamyl-gamma-aminobutyrate hydrolase family protein [Flavobacteriales bacterium]|nr:gamma-glutamyl-gamma-aminobutyrate hydrolase family protein [Flavobacteriales bacterium]